MCSLMTAPFNDEPTLVDHLGRAGWVRWFAANVRNCSPPYVFSVHGDWGSGKTSFLHQLYGFFTGHKPSGEKLLPQETDLWGAKWKPADRYMVIWFEAWRYQNELVPVVAMLHELRGQWAWYRRTFEWVKKITEVTARGALLVIDEATRKIDDENTVKLKPSASGIQALGERWEAEHFQTPLATQKLREFLCEAIRTLIGKKGRLVVLIDDLDRCQPEAAYKLLEGIKIYLNLPNCVFVLAMDQRQLERAIAQCLPGGSKGAGDGGLPPVGAMQQAREYLEKICQDVWQLPLIPLEKHCEYMNLCLEGHCPGKENAVADILSVFKGKNYLPANARKLKAYANTLRRFMEHCSSSSGSNRERHAKLIGVFSCLYQFHPDLYRRLESNPRFYNEVREWAADGRSRNPVFQDIEIAGVAPENTPAGGPPSSPGRFVTFPDPATGNVFRIRDLILEVQAVPEQEVKCYLLPHART